MRSPDVNSIAVCVYEYDNILRENIFLLSQKLAESSYTLFTDLALVQEIWFPGFFLAGTQHSLLFWLLLVKFVVVHGERCKVNP